MGRDGKHAQSGWTAEDLRLRVSRLGWGNQRLTKELCDAAVPDLARRLPSRKSVERSVRNHLAGASSPNPVHSECYRRVFASHGLSELPSKVPSNAGAGEEQLRELLCRTFMKQGLALTALPALSQGQGRRVVQALQMMDSDHLGSVAVSLGELVDHYAQTIYVPPPAEV